MNASQLKLNMLRKFRGLKHLHKLAFDAKVTLDVEDDL